MRGGRWQIRYCRDKKIAHTHTHARTIDGRFVLIKLKLTNDRGKGTPGPQLTFCNDVYVRSGASLINYTRVVRHSSLPFYLSSRFGSFDKCVRVLRVSRCRSSSQSSLLVLASHTPFPTRFTTPLLGNNCVCIVYTYILYTSNIKSPPHTPHRPFMIIWP